MEKRSKGPILAALCIMFSVFFMISILLAYYNKQNPKDVLYPSGDLSDSIFESQNTNYMEKESLPTQVLMKNIPYSYDAPNVDAAVVDNGHIYKLSSGVYLYATEFPKSSAIEATIAHELGTALLMDLDESQSIMRIMLNENGFINGYDAKYLVDRLVVTNGEERVDCNLVGYELVVPNTTENVFLCVATVEPGSTQVFNNLKSMTQALLFTFRYSPDAQTALDKQKEAAAEAAAKEMRAAQEAQEKAEAVAEQEAAQEAKTKYMAANINKDYENLQLNIYWTNAASSPDITLYTPDKSASYRPAEAGRGEVIFRVGQAQKGTWIVEINGTDYGECSLEQTELAGNNENGEEDGI